MAATCPECPARLSECRTKSEINNSDIGMLHAARFLRRQCGMTAARQILPGRVYMITRRCTQRTFLLRPDPATTQTFLYCLAHAAEQTGVTVLGSVVMSNHHHTIIYDPKDFLSAFMESLHGLVARAMNCLRGRWEHFWDEQQVNAPPLVEVSDVLRMMAYAATNPVRADLVEHAEQWPGLNTAEAFLRGTPLTVERPRHFFRQQGKGCLPERLTLTLGWPESLGPVDAARRALRGLIDEIDTFCVRHGLPFRRWSGGCPGAFHPEIILFEGEGPIRAYMASEDEQLLFSPAEIKAFTRLRDLRRAIARTELTMPPFVLI